MPTLKEGPSLTLPALTEERPQTSQEKSIQGILMMLKQWFLFPVTLVLSLALGPYLIQGIVEEQHGAVTLAARTVEPMAGSGA